MVRLWVVYSWSARRATSNSHGSSENPKSARDLDSVRPRRKH